MVPKTKLLLPLILIFAESADLHSQIEGEQPLYATYAAALERSAYVLDEGYRLRFDDPERGIDFYTDTAGDICLAFKSGADLKYYLKDMLQTPVIKFSYPDMVRYHYYPFSGLRTEVTFFVYSSQISLMDVQLINETSSQLNFIVYPFLQNTYRTFEKVDLTPRAGSVTFMHEEFPDSWTLEHDIPFADTVYNIYVNSVTPDNIKSFRSFSWEEITIPQQIDLNKKQKYLIWGKLTHANGERCRHTTPHPQLILFLNGDHKNLLTETAPRWEKTDPTFNQYGYYFVELGNYENLADGDQYDLQVFCPVTGESGRIRDEVVNSDKLTERRYDLLLDKRNLIFLLIL